MTGAAALATSCQDDTLASSSAATGPDADGTLRVVSLTLDGRELAATTGAGSRAVYDTYDYVKQSDGNYAWTNTAPLVDKNGDTDDTTLGKYYSNQPNRIITEFSDGDAMKAAYAFDDASDHRIYLKKTASGWEFRSYDKNTDAIGDKLTIRPESSSESWDKFWMEAWTNGNYKEIEAGNATYNFPVKCTRYIDQLIVGCSYGYAHSSEWKAKYGTDGTEGTNYTDMQAGRVPSADLVASHPGSYHVGTTDKDRGQLTLNLMHEKLALLTLSDGDLTISGWPEGYDAIATLRADQMVNTNTDVNDEMDNSDSFSGFRPVFSRLRIGTMGEDGKMTDEIASGTESPPPCSAGKPSSVPSP